MKHRVKPENETNFEKKRRKFSEKRYHSLSAFIFQSFICLGLNYVKKYDERRRKQLFFILFLDKKKMI